MHGRTILIAGAAGALILAVAGIWAKSVPSAAEPSSSELKQLQGLADQACLCRRKNGGADCNAAFERAIGRYEHDEGATACMEGSVATVCFGPDDGRGWADHCVFRERSYGACSAGEEQARAAKAGATC